MTTYGTMQDRIASDLERTLADTAHAESGRTWGDEIKSAINDAIKLYKSKRWWFVQGPTSAALTSTTTASNSYVSDYTGLINLRSLRITINGQLLELEPVTFQAMEEMHDGNDSAGQPYKYCRFGGRVRLYPTPDNTYTLTWSGTFEAATLTNDADTNDWMTDGEMVVRSMAKLIMLRDYIKSYDDVPAATQAVMIAEKALDREHTARTARGKISARS